MPAQSSSTVRSAKRAAGRRQSRGADTARAQRILLVDDEPRLTRLVQANLESVGYRVVTADEAQTALAVMTEQPPDLVLLDIMLPGIDGYELCRRIRERADVPIIMLTAKSREADKIRGFNVGADDYLTKPFNPEELLARVRAVLRRSQASAETKLPSAFRSGELEIDFSRQLVMVRGNEVELTPTEYKLLRQLALHAGNVVAHEELLTKVWGPEYREDVEYLRQYVYYLRQKIERQPTRPELILSKPGIGYRIATPDGAIGSPE
ncbi:MAG: response regulator transcription factor [Chloroflexi bacterium]|nr:response regulator transcription factor [Chloroflexota bacterium]